MSNIGVVGSDMAREMGKFTIGSLARAAANPLRQSRPQSYRKKSIDNIRLFDYGLFMKNEARLFKSLGDETRLMILWLLMQKEELCVCDIMEVLEITQSKASRHLRYLFHLGWVTDRRDGLWMNYRISVAPGSQQDRQLRLLGEFFQDHPEAQALKARLEKWMEAKGKASGTGEGAYCSCK